MADLLFDWFVLGCFGYVELSESCYILCNVFKWKKWNCQKIQALSQVRSVSLSERAFLSLSNKLDCSQFNMFEKDDFENYDMTSNIQQSFVLSKSSHMTCNIRSECFISYRRCQNLFLCQWILVGTFQQNNNLLQTTFSSASEGFEPSTSRPTRCVSTSRPCATTSDGCTP